MIYPLLLICAAALLAVYIREKIRACSVKALLLKAAESMLFVAVGVCGFWRCAAAGRAGPLCPFVLLGLVFGLTGDIWLDLKYVFPEQDAPFTRAGFCVFGIGHLLFMAGMLLYRYPAGRLPAVLLPLLLGAALSAVNILLEKLMKLDYGRLRTLVFAYGVLLFSMVLLAGSLALAHGWRDTPLNLLFAGGAAFALSDLVLSGTYFGVGKDRPVDIALNYLCYYPAQFLIASSLVFL